MAPPSVLSADQLSPCLLKQQAGGHRADLVSTPCWERKRFLVTCPGGLPCTWGRESGLPARAEIWASGSSCVPSPGPGCESPGLGLAHGGTDQGSRLLSTPAHPFLFPVTRAALRSYGVGGSGSRQGQLRKLRTGDLCPHSRPAVAKGDRSPSRVGANDLSTRASAASPGVSEHLGAHVSPTGCSVPASTTPAGAPVTAAALASTSSRGSQLPLTAPTSASVSPLCPLTCPAVGPLVMGCVLEDVLTPVSSSL